MLSCGVDSEALGKWQARPSFRKPRQYPSEAFRFVEAQSFSAGHLSRWSLPGDGTQVGNRNIRLAMACRVRSLASSASGWRYRGVKRALYLLGEFGDQFLVFDDALLAFRIG